jgi:hypothetical protein
MDALHAVSTKLPTLVSAHLVSAWLVFSSVEATVMTDTLLFYESDVTTRSGYGSARRVLSVSAHVWNTDDT